jgi:Tol biopolymer transport system component
MSGLIDTWFIQLRFDDIDFTCEDHMLWYITFGEPVTERSIRQIILKRAFDAKREQPEFVVSLNQEVIQALTLDDCLVTIEDIKKYLLYMTTMIENGFVGTVSQSQIEFAMASVKSVEAELQELKND